MTLLDPASPLGRLSHHLSAVTDPRQLEDSLRHWSAGLEIAPLPANLAILRKITLNTLQVHAPFPGKKGAAMSIRSRQYLASLIQNPYLTA